jgi:acylphosphatase
LENQTRARRFYVSGRVQGVGYRWFAQTSAEQLGVAGYARNLSDGRVEVYAIGSAEQLRELARELQRGPQLAAVTDVSESEAELLATFASGFSVRGEYEG